MRVQRLPDTLVRATILSGRDLGQWRREFDEGIRPSALPYGIDALEPLGYSFSSPRVGANRAASKVRDVVEHRLGRPVEGALRAMPAVGRSDVVFALLEQHGELASQLKGRGVWPYARTPLVIWSVWFAERLSRMSRDDRRGLTRRYRSCDLFVHMAEAEQDILIDSGFTEDQLMVMTYGVADSFYSPTDRPRDIDILAIGQDLGRDYATLFRAVRGTELRVELVCKPINIRGLDIPANVTWRGTVSHTEYADLLRRANVVVVPTHDLMYPTGSSVALEAAASGAAVVVTDTPAMRSLFTHGETALMVGVGDDESMRRTLSEVSANDALRRELGARARLSVEKRFNSRVMWGEVNDVINARGILDSQGRRG